MRSTWEAISASIFDRFLLDFGLQVGRENGAQIDPKRHPKSDKNLKEESWRRLGALGDFYLWYACGTRVGTQRAPIRIL